MQPAIIGPLGPAQLACLRSWERKDWKPIFIQTGEHRATRPHNIECHNYLHVADFHSEQEQLRLILEFLGQYKKVGLTCLSYKTMQWLHKHENDLPPSVALWISTPEALATLRSKTLQMRIATEAGLPLLHSFHIDRTYSSQDIAPDEFPLVLRPSDETKVVPSFKMHLVENGEALDQFLSSRSKLECQIIAQPFINGPNFIVHGARTHKGKHNYQAAFMAHRKLEGVSLTIEPSPLLPDIAQGCRDFTDRMGYIGIYHFEFILDQNSNKYFFLEINGRLGGTTGKVYACGYDEPGYLVHAFGGTQTAVERYQPSRRKFVCTNKRSLLKALVGLSRHRLTLFDYPSTSSKWYFLKLLWGMLVWRDEILSLRDIRSGLTYTRHETLPIRNKR